MNDKTVLLKTDNIRLRYECDSVLAENFAGQFDDIWKSLPCGFRKVIKLHWEIINKGCEIFIQSYGRTFIGRTKNKGYLIEFDSDIISQASQGHLIEAAVAHELSHVYFIALEENSHSNKLSQWPSQSEIHANKIATELLASELTRRLGYKQDSLFEWFNTTSCKNTITSEELWERWNALELKWQEHFYPEHENSTTALHDYYHAKDSYFKIATDEGAFEEWGDISSVKRSLNK
tara:strand:- start:27191 stop:27892 length:702 start_codon:yes stop_codon:yes gene_type:complete